MSGTHLRLIHMLQRGRHTELETAARELLGKDMEDSVAWIYLGQALMGQQKLAAAEEAARKAISTSPDSDGGHYLLALVLLERNQPKEALTTAREAVRLDPTDSLNHALTARALNQLSRYAEAAASAEAGLRVTAGCDSCLFQLSQAKAYLGHHEEADEVTRALLADDPEDAANHSARGYHLLFAGNPAEARHHFLEALRLRPNDQDARYGLAQSLTNRNAVFRLGLKVMLLFERWGWKGLLIAAGAVLLLAELPKIAKNLPGAVPLTSLLLGLGALLIMLVMCHRPLSTLMLLMDREARLVVSRSERMATLWCLPILAIVLWHLGWWIHTGITTGSLSKWPSGVFTWALLMALVWETFEAETRWVRQRMATLTVVVTLIISAASLARQWNTQRLVRELRPLAESAKQGGQPASDEMKARLRQSMTAGLRINRHLQLVELAALLLCLFSDNIRQFLERRAPDP